MAISKKTWNSVYVTLLMYLMGVGFEKLNLNFYFIFDICELGLGLLTEQRRSQKPCFHCMYRVFCEFHLLQICPLSYNIN